MKSWERIQSELKALQSSLSGQPLVIELTFYKSLYERTEPLLRRSFTVSELIKADLEKIEPGATWHEWRVKKGSNLQDVSKFLHWICENDVIE